MKYLPKLASGEFIGAWGLTEQGTGSDAGGMSTVAVQDGDYWVINGAKNFITHGISGDVAVVITRTGEKGTSNSTTAFIIEKGTPGFEGGKKKQIYPNTRKNTRGNQIMASRGGSRNSHQ